MKILKKSKNNEVIRINDVEIGTPTYAYDLARTIILNLNMVKGVYHITNSGIASRFHYAENILCLTTNGKILVNNDLNDDVKRPRKSILNSDIQFCLRHWTEALHEYLMNWKE